MLIPEVNKENLYNSTFIKNGEVALLYHESKESNIKRLCPILLDRVKELVMTASYDKVFGEEAQLPPQRFDKN